MFSKEVVCSDIFLDMPPSTQLLYFQFGMEADDDGFLGSPQKLIRAFGANKDELEILKAKGFVIPFDSGVIVIRHWKENNQIRSDRYKETIFKSEKSLLKEGQNGWYELGIPNGNQMATQYSIGKDRLGKDSIEDMSDKSDAFSQFWDKYPKKELKKKTLEIWKRKKLDSRLGEILAFIEKASLTDRWKKGFVKQPPVFLNGECWNDDLTSYGDKKGLQVPLEVMKF